MTGAEISVGDEYWFYSYNRYGAGVYNVRKLAVHKVYKTGAVIFEKGGQQYKPNHDGSLSATGSRRWNREHVQPNTEKVRALIDNETAKYEAINMQREIANKLSSSRLALSVDRIRRMKAIMDEAPPTE